MIEPKVCLVCVNLDMASSFSDFCEGKILVYDSFSFGAKHIPTCFVNLLRKYGFPIRITFFCISTKNVPAFFCQILVGITAFLRKIAVVSLKFEQKFYDNGARTALSRLKAVISELLAHLDEQR